ncbi:hypothetical protein [Tenacibaculum sp. 190130A14a]|uniref:Uncharacterized protein n=1 Tax=Tenacibaculum polynesiense TaxID=3137857 RepID=A0ABM9PG43_9FLAO
MAETEFKITLNETGQSMSRTLTGKRLAFFNPKWSYDKEGKNTITKAELSETVYFHIELTGLPNNWDLTFKLFDHDNLIRDGLDDKKFDGKEVEIKTNVYEENNVKKATVKLELDQRWEPLLLKDTGHDLELYWKINFIKPNSTAEGSSTVPKFEEERLEVELSSQTLFFKPSINGGKLPQLIANDGTPLYLVNLKNAVIDEVTNKIKSETKSYLKNKAKDIINNTVKEHNNKIENKVTTIALVKLAKGNIVDRNGKIHSKTRNIYQYTEEVFGKEIIVKRGKHFGNETVKSAPNQAHFFATNGEKVEILNAKKIKPIMNTDNAFKLFDKLFNIVDFSMSELDEITSNPLSVPSVGSQKITSLLGKNAALGISLWVEFLGYLAMVEHKKIEKLVDNELEYKLEKAKLEGYDAVFKFVNSYKTHDIIEISSETFSALLLGKFKTLDEVLNYQSKIIDDFNLNIKLLVKTKIEEEKIKPTEIIESIFIN